MGIGRPPPRWDPADYVLSRFTAEERASVERAVEDAVGAIEMILTDGVTKAMNKFNRGPTPAGGPEKADEEAPAGKARRG